MHSRYYLYSRALRSYGDIDWKLSNKSQKQGAKRCYVDKAINQNSNKPKYMWSKLKEFLPSKSSGSSSAYIESYNVIT